jgi:carbon storage regulator CsrA
MLVLSRFRDESVVIRTKHGEIITVTVVDIPGAKVRLGFTAPIDIEINREEIDVICQRERAVAALPGSGGSGGGNSGPLAGRQGR